MASSVVFAASCAPQGRPPSDIGLSEPGVPAEHAGAPRGTASAAAVPPPSPLPSGTSPVTSAENAGAPSKDGRVPLADDWPPDTRSLRVGETAHVLNAPMDRALYIGKIVGGTRVGWRRVVAPDPEDPAVVKKRHHRRGEPCLEWVEILPRGFLCKALLSPSRDEPYGVPQPVVRAGHLTPDEYFKVMADETKVYRTADDVRAEVVDKLVSTKVMLVGEGALQIDETPYLKTDHGLIEAGALAKFWPSDFAGVKVSGERTLPFAWVFFERGARRPPVYPTPDAEAKPVRDAARREIVPLLEETNGFVRIGDAQWIERRHLRVAAVTAPPPGLSPDAQWIDVDLDEQVLVAYEGTTPVFATMVSTGGRKNPTPPATYRVRAKAATTTMAGDAKIPNRYEVSAVPWAVRFADGFFIHGVYWHDGFGGARSHGCVNVSPRDAAYIFDWIGPEVPDGWSEIEVLDGQGAIVRLRDRKNPDPKPFDYSHEDPQGEGRAASGTNRF
ncbi:MAG TPA: L,D-transpeptidase [Polyangiaceae bacterium]|nr:L,D-transpeptidase [Polyangiaceae bacterium]